MSLSQSSLTDLITIIFTIIVIGIYLPLTICYGIKFYANRNHVALKQRYSFITILEILFSSIYFILNCAANIRALLINDNDSNETDKYYINFIITSLIEICFTFIFSCWIWKFWLIMFDLKWILSINNQQWIYIINPNSIQLIHKGWFLSNKHKYGNIKWIRKHFIIPWNLIWSIISLIGNYFMIECTNSNLWCIIPTYTYYGLFLIFNTWFSWIILFFIYCKIPSFQDEFYILNELKRLIFIMSIMGIDQILMVIPLNSFISLSSAVIWKIHYFIQQTTLMLIIMISTRWVMRKLKKIINVKKTRHNYKGIKMKSQDIHSMLINSSITSDYNNHNNYNNMDRYKKADDNELKYIFKNHDTFELFMMYLSMELSMEFLLAFVEIIQYQRYVWKLRHDIDINTDNFIDSLFQTIKFYPTIVKSYIVYCDDGDNDNCNDNNKYNDDRSSVILYNSGYKRNQHLIKNLKIKAHKIFKKYIEYGSEYEAILTSCAHDKICNIMGNDDWIYDKKININHVLKLFDHVTDELFILLLDSFNRFQDTLQYRIVNKNNNNKYNGNYSTHKGSLEIDSSTYMQ